jgi:hypothetical protein
MSDPSVPSEFSSVVLSWVVNAVFAIALLVGRITYGRSIQKQDDLEHRVRALEKDSVTHDDLRRIENKMDDFTKQVTERLDRILERQQ